VLAFHRVLSVQLTRSVRAEQPVLGDDEDVDDYVPPASLPSDSVDGATVGAD